MEAFQGRILHSDDFRSVETFKDLRVLVIGTIYLAEGIVIESVIQVQCEISAPLLTYSPHGIPLVENFHQRASPHQDRSGEQDVSLQGRFHRQN